ncbi:MAG: sulfotransferase [Planctomycetota bacterium]
MSHPQPRIFFIVGSPRSGTTLLQTMLMQAPGVTIPPETHFVSLTYDRRRIHGPIETDAGWLAGTEAILKRNALAEFPIADDRLRERLAEPGPRTYARMLTNWLSLCAEHAEAGTVGEKSPGHTEHIPRLAEWFPDARFVHIVRDPRDVALSHAEVWDRSTLQAALRWRFDQRLVRSAGGLLEHRIRTVRYEDLVAEPAGTIRAAAAFLGIEFVEAMTDPSNRTQTGFAAYEKHKQQTLEKVTTSRIQRYKGKLAASAVAEIQLLCGREMRRLGYEPEPAGLLKGLTAAAADTPKLLADHAARHLRIRRNVHRN